MTMMTVTRLLDLSTENIGWLLHCSVIRGRGKKSRFDDQQNFDSAFVRNTKDRGLMRKVERYKQKQKQKQSINKNYDDKETIKATYNKKSRAKPFCLATTLKNHKIQRSLQDIIDVYVPNSKEIFIGLTPSPVKQSFNYLSFALKLPNLSLPHAWVL